MNENGLTDPHKILKSKNIEKTLKISRRKKWLIPKTQESDYEIAHLQQG